MNILFLCNKNPYPEKDGGCHAMNVMINEAVRRGCYVKVLAVNSVKNYSDINLFPSDYSNNTHYETITLDMKIYPLTFIKTYFNGQSPHVVRFFSEDFARRVVEILNETRFDIVRIESLFMCPYIDVVRKHSSAVIDMRAHNVEHRIWERMCSSTNNVVRRMLLRHVASTLKRYEMQAIRKVDCISAISLQDAEWFKANTDVTVNYVPFGFDITAVKYPSGVIPEHDSVFYIGAMNWMPNYEGVKWFLMNVCPLLEKKIPLLKCYLAGHDMPQEFFDNHPDNVIVVGEVADAQQFICSKNIMIVPLLSGSGVRVKIIEGMMMSKAIVTTTIGAEGIDVKNGYDIIIADTPIEMADSIVSLVHNDKLAHEIGGNAKNTVAQYDIRDIFDKWMKQVMMLKQ